MNEHIFDTFATAAEQAGDAPFLCIPASAQRTYHPDGVEYSYSETLDKVNKLAASYEAWGLAGKRVALLAGNQPEHFFHFLAANAAGASVVPLNPDYMTHEFEYVIGHAGVACIIATPEYMPKLRAASLTDIPSLNTDNLPPDCSLASECTETITADEALVIYTSGTTGFPKGCLISNCCALAAGRCYATMGGRMELQHMQDRLYLPLPTYHANASVIAMNAMIQTGNCLIVPDRFHPASWWKDLVETRATAVHYLGIIPPIMMKMEPTEAERQHQVRFGFGAGVVPELHAAFEERFGFPLVEGWGMTETGRIIADAQEPRNITSRAIGKPSAPLEARVLNDAGEDARDGESGELLVRCSGPDPRCGFFSGYLKDATATEAAWVGGWFHTGDVVTRDGDGTIYFVERKKNIIRRSGENISAAEVEGALSQLPEVEDVAVIAVEDELRDEEVMACVVLAPGFDRTGDTAQRIFTSAKDRLLYYKLPGWIVYVDEIPVTGTQKVRKGVIFAKEEDPKAHPMAYDLRRLKTRNGGVRQIPTRAR